MFNIMSFQEELIESDFNHLLMGSFDTLLGFAVRCSVM